MFKAEALGLSRMYETDTIRVPQPFKVPNMIKLYYYLVIDLEETLGDQVRSSLLDDDPGVCQPSIFLS